MPFPLSATLLAEVEQLNADWMSAYESQDIQKVAETYTSNGKILPADMNYATGRPDIAKLHQLLLDKGVAAIKLQVDECYATDPTPEPHCIIQLAKWTMKDQQGNNIDKGKFLAVLTKEDGQYRYLYDMFSSNGKPMAE